MCTHQREIKNPYTGQPLYVKCGHCEACLVEKAMHRVQKIRSNDSDATERYLISLTYGRDCSPYVLRNEAYEFAHGNLAILNVYRDCEYRYKRTSSSYDTELIKTKKLCFLGEVPFDKEVSFHGVKDLAYQHDHVGVCWYPDLQNFFKRLRINLDRLGYDIPFTSFQCSEYGVSSLRPHFHILADVPRGFEETFKSAVNEAWPFSNLSQFPRAFERAFRASSYVASYINKPAGFPPFLELYFKNRCSYSKGYGLADCRFSFSSLLYMFERGSLSYSRIVKKGQLEKRVTLPVPTYVINRYFPKFKGSNSYSLSSFLHNVRRIVLCDYDKTDGFNEDTDENDLRSIQLESSSGRPIFYDFYDIHKISVRLTNAWSRINRDYPQYYISSLHDYLLLYYHFWALYSSTVLRLHLENDEIPFKEKYDNLEYVKCKLDFIDNYPMPVGFDNSDFEVTDPNMFHSNVFRSQVLTKSFHDSLYKKKVAHSIYSQQRDYQL